MLRHVFFIHWTEKKKKKKKKGTKKRLPTSNSKFRINAIVIFLHVSNEKKGEKEGKRKGEKFTVRNSTEEGQGDASSRISPRANPFFERNFRAGRFRAHVSRHNSREMTFRQWMLVNECNASPVIRARDKIPRTACRSALLIRTFHPPCAG